MTTLHSSLTDPNLHEPKGVAAASAGTVYVANGSGSGSWNAQKNNSVALVRTIVNLATAGDSYVVSPVAGTITQIYGVLEAAIGTGNGSLTFFINGVAILGSTITVIESGSAAGQEYNSTPSGSNTVNPGDVIKITSASGPSGTAPFTVTLLINANS